MAKPRISIAVPESTRKRWKEHAEDSDQYTGLSDLIRTGVVAQINTDTGDVSQSDPSADLAGITDTLTDLSSGMERIDNRLNQIEDTSGVEAPYVKQETIHRYLGQITDPIGEGTPDECGVTAGRVANDLDEPESVVRDALNALTTVSNVRKGRPAAENENFYWKES